MLSAQAGAGSARPALQKGGASGVEEEEGLQQFGSGLSAEKHGVHAWITTPC